VTHLALPPCRPKGATCEMFPDLVTPLHAIGWAVVASLLVHLVFKLLGRADGWPVIGLGCAFWILLWIAVPVLGVTGGDGGIFFVPVLAYGLAAVVVRSRADE
jgi:hypothetical protein